MRKLLLLAALIPGPALSQSNAQTLDPRDGDSLIASADRDMRLRGQEITFFDDGVAHFYNDGRYTYAYDMGDGGYAYGYFEIVNDSTVCIDFLGGFARCDAYVENAGRLVLITSEGDRFPIREERDAGPDPLLE